MKQTFKTFLIENEAHRELTLEETLALAMKSHSQAMKQLKKDAMIWRGVAVNKQFILSDPKVEIRKSSESHNFVNFTVSNFWKRYPRRDGCVIATTRKSHATSYGHTYLVLPENNANIGVCPSEDFWYSFENLRKTVGVGSVDSFNAQFFLFIRSYYEGTVKYTNFAEMKVVLDQVSKTLTEFGKDTVMKHLAADKSKNKDPEFASGIIKLFFGKANQDLVNVIKILFDADYNGFQLIKTNDLEDVTGTGATEIWTDGKCLLIADSIVKEFIRLYNEQ